MEEIDTSTLAKGTVWSFLAQLALKLFSFFYLVILAKFFSAEEIGIFYFALSVVSFITIFTDLGLNQSLPRYVPYLYGKGKAAIIRSFMKIMFLAGSFLSLSFSIFLFFSASFIASALGKPETAPAFQALAFLPFLSELAGLGGGFLVGRKLIRDFQVVNNLQGITKLIFTIAFGFLIAFSATSLGYAYLASYLPLIIGYSYFMLKDLNSLKGGAAEEKLEKDLVLEVFYFGLILSLIATFYVIASSTDRFMLGFLGGERAMGQVGIYSVVTTFANLLLLPFSALLTIFFPMVSELFGREKMEEMRKMTSVAVKWSIILGAPFFILLISLPDLLLRMFYGPEYAAASNVFILYLISFAIFSVSLLPMKVIAAMRRLDIELAIAGTCAFANIVFNWFLIPVWGMDGAAFATLLSFSLMAVLTFFYSKKLFDFSFPKDSAKPVLASIVALILFFTASQYVSPLVSSLPLDEIAKATEILDASIAGKLIKLALFAVFFAAVCAIYLIVLIITKSFGKEELAIIRKALPRMKVPEQYAERAANILSGTY